MSAKNDIMVTVCIMTYNQEKWIRQTLDSVLSQQTDYPYEVIIGEDHGTDGTRAICQEYADKYKNVMLLPSEKNLGVTANWIQCVRAGKGKYIMTCAGDDWWHNPNKIQMQVDYMEIHPECVLLHTDYDCINDNTGEICHNYNASRDIVPPSTNQQMAIRGGKLIISPLTSCIRRDAMERYVPMDKFIELDFPREDWPTYLILSAHGEMHYVPVSTATYRVGHESITNTRNYDKIRKRYEQDKRMTEYLYALFPEWGAFKDGPWFDKQVNHALLMAAYDNNDYKSACKFRKLDRTHSLAKKMAYTWLTFQIYRNRRGHREQ